MGIELELGKGSPLPDDGLGPIRRIHIKMDTSQPLTLGEVRIWEDHTAGYFHETGEQGGMEPAAVTSEMLRRALGGRACNLGS